MTWSPRPRSDFGSLRAIESGDGPHALLIHGVGLRAEAWNSQIDALSTRFHTIAVDMPGHGQSPLPARELNLSDYTELIADGLNASALVIGHSMGAMIALQMATRHPHLVKGVVALNAVFQRGQAAVNAVKARANSLDGVTITDPSDPLTRWFGDVASPERDACRTWLTDNDPAAYRMAYTVFAHENGPKPSALKSLTCPALFLTGRDEPNSTPRMSEEMAKLVPHGRAQIIENAAHMMPMTHASEVNTALLGFALEVWS